VWRILGHPHLVKQIEAALARNALAHAHLVVGPPHTGKLTLALDIACAVNCVEESGRPCGQCSQCKRILAGQHADVLLISVPREASRKEIFIDTVRDVEHQASLMPFEGRYRAIIVEEAERMSHQAANALLKTLEEPPGHVLFILTSAHEEALLPTVRSRCQRLELRCLPYDTLADALAKDHGVSREDAAKLARLARGCAGLALRLAAQPRLLEERLQAMERIARMSEATLAERFRYAGEVATAFHRDREEARETLHLWLQWWRDILLVREGVSSHVHNVDGMTLMKEQAARYTTRQVVDSIRALRYTLDALEQNANARLALENLMMALPLERTRHE
jgi:DNA polymerase-3 subunit delta'